MKKILLGTITFLTIASSFAQVPNISLVKSFNIGTEVLNYINIFDDYLVYSLQDQIILLNLLNLKETRITVKSPKAQNIKTHITKFKILPNKNIAVINNEPFILLYNPYQNTKIELPFNIESNQKTYNNLFIYQIENIEDLDISNTGKFLLIKKRISKLFLGLFPLEDYYEYSLLLYPNLSVINTISSKEISINGSIIFSKKDNYLFLTNISATLNNKSYGLFVLDLKNQKSYNLLENTSVIDLDITNSDELLAISTEDNYFKILNIKSLKEIFSYPVSGYIKFSPQDDLLIVEGGRTINIFDLKSKELVASYLGSNPYISPNQNYLAYSISKDFASLTKEIVIINRNTNLQRIISFKEEYFLEDMRFSKDENFLILMLSGKNGYKIEIYKI